MISVKRTRRKNMSAEAIEYLIITGTLFLVYLIIVIVSTKAKTRRCDIFVQDGRGNQCYHCTAYRISKRGMELRIFNPASKDLEWRHVWMFKNPAAITYFLDEAYAINLYNLENPPRSKDNDFTKRRK